MKRFSKCKHVKEDFDFHLDKKQQSGLKSWCKQCVNSHIKNRYWKDPIKSAEKARRQHIKLYYGITNEEYLKIFNDQNGECAICGKHQNEIKKRLFVDHDHKTGKLRGLLCRQCNSILGYSYDNINILLKTIEYLNK